MLALKYPSGMLLQSRMSKSPRPIPAIPWYKTLIPNMALAGFLPFAAIYVELHLIFASVWGYKVYTIYTVLAVMFPLLILVTSFVTIALLYFQLMAEDWRWWWRSFLSGGSTGMYIYMYAFYFFYFKSSMGGLMQVAFYFGYCFIACYAVFLMLGAVGWISAMLFVRRIFVLVKSE